ncbi:MAG: response regulator [Spirochaetes bacterium]|nr:response regulator [Spirochaetota bacterium]
MKESKRILVAEDDSAMAALFRETLEAEHYEVTVSENGAEALKQFEAEPFPIVMTDIEMPVMDGYELITRLKERDDTPLIFVATVNSDYNFIIDIMKMGVYDYIVKPVDLGALAIKVERAFESQKMKRMQRIVERERQIRLEHQLEWLQWQSRMEVKDGKVDKSLFHNMHISFSQGTGFGALITLLNIVANSAEVQGEHYIISREMMDLVKKNALVAENAINTFSEIELIISNPLPLEKVSCYALHGIMAEIKERAVQYEALNGNHIMLSDLKPFFAGKFVSVSEEHLRKAVYELLINALKFSEKNSEIYIFLDIHDKNAVISVISQSARDEEGRRGIPMEYENLVFEPFFRMTKIVREGYDTFDYGLGLTMAEKIIDKHAGKITGRNITDHSDISKGPVSKVEFSVSLPLLDGGEGGVQ